MASLFTIYTHIIHESIYVHIGKNEWHQYLLGGGRVGEVLLAYSYTYIQQTGVRNSTAKTRREATIIAKVK